MVGARRLAYGVLCVLCVCFVCVCVRARACVCVRVCVSVCQCSMVRSGTRSLLSLVSSASQVGSGRRVYNVCVLSVCT